MNNDLDKNIEDTADIFKDYMQCFSNKKTKEIVNDKKFIELVKDHKFWDTQPVPKKEKIKDDNIKGKLKDKDISKVSKIPLKLKENLEWMDIDINIDEDAEKVYLFLRDNYVEDDDGNFRFNYSPEFLRWALNPPKADKELYFGIKDNITNELIGFITGIILEMKLEDKNINVTEVNFLCVHKKFRKDNIAPILIQEVVRRLNLKNVWQGLFTSGTILPTPFCQTRYYHRNLNPEKLLKIKFSYLDPKSSKKLYFDYHKVKDEMPYNFVQMKEEDLKQVRNLLIEYLSKFQVHQHWSKKEVEHFLLPKKNIVESFVLKKNGKVTDFFSFYDLSSSILNNAKFKMLKAAYSFYYFNTSISLEDLFNCTIIMAKKQGYDVFNALDLLDNEVIFDNLKFSKGDGYLQYYLYNWKLSKGYISPNQLGVVLF